MFFIGRKTFLTYYNWSTLNFNWTIWLMKGHLLNQKKKHIEVLVENKQDKSTKKYTQLKHLNLTVLFNQIGYNYAKQI